jgi:hypothetical protein
VAEQCFLSEKGGRGEESVVVFSPSVIAMFSMLFAVSWMVRVGCFAFTSRCLACDF